MKLRDFIYQNIIRPKPVKKLILESNTELESEIGTNCKTSISDDDLYPKFCKLASENSLVFRIFKSDPIYLKILEHVNYEQGGKYLEEIEKKSPQLLKNLEEFIKNDNYGRPKKYKYDKIKKKVSPTTLRYIKVLSDLIFFGLLEEGSKICEIGIGYGGQCRIILSHIKIESYTLVDLQEVLLLSKRYLENYPIFERTRYIQMEQLNNDIDYDFVMSNYAFSELRKEIQDIYLEKVILNSKAGYITYNNLSNKYLNGYSSDELLNIIQGSIKVDEVPLTHEGNCIIIWGYKNNYN